jgi:hypothetical protein
LHLNANKSPQLDPLIDRETANILHIGGC